MSIFKTVINKINRDLTSKSGRKRPLVYMAGEDHPDLIHPMIPCNIPAINADLGGGFRGGNVHLITGNYGSGKTALVASCLKNAKALGYEPIYVIMEPGLPSSTFLNVGLALNDVHIVAAEKSEEVSEMVVKLLTELRDQNREKVWIVFDSINAFTPSSLLNRQDNKGHDSAGMAERARALGVFLERIAGTNLLASGSGIQIISQKRSTLSMYGPSEVPAGGKAVTYMPKTIVHLNAKQIKKKISRNGHEVYIPYALEVTYQIEKNTAGGSLNADGKIIGNVPTSGVYVYTFPTEDNPGGIDDSLFLFEYAVVNGFTSKDGREWLFNLPDSTVVRTGTTKKDEVPDFIRSDERLQDVLRTHLQNPLAFENSGEVIETDTEELQVPTNQSDSIESPLSID